MKQLLILSGKGGTGKTSITAAFATLANDAILADCDVDAADLHIILKPEIIESHQFTGGKVAILDNNLCIQCGNCVSLCRFDAVKRNKIIKIDELACEGCGVCSWNCPTNAIKMQDSISGDYYISKTRYGMMAHAKLLPGAENSGKLVAIVRQNARDLAKEYNKDLIIIDGPPGIGCPVIASMTGVDYVLIVTEPTVSGLHDLMRTIELASNFKVKCSVCINKYDINTNMSDKIAEYLHTNNITLLGKIPYDNSFTKAQRLSQSIIEYKENNLQPIIKNIYSTIINNL